MIGHVRYRGVVFGIYATASTHDGNSVVRPIATTDGRLGGLLAGKDMTGCVGKSFKMKRDENSDTFGISLAVYRGYRALVGMAKSELHRRMEMLNNMQKESKVDQQRAYKRQFPKTKLPAKAQKRLTAGKKRVR